MSGTAQFAHGLLAFLLAVCTHIALVYLAIQLIVETSVVRAGGDASVAADADVLVDGYDAILTGVSSAGRAGSNARSVVTVLARGRSPYVLQVGVSTGRTIVYGTTLAVVYLDTGYAGRNIVFHLAGDDAGTAAYTAM